MSKINVKMTQPKYIIKPEDSTIYNEILNKDIKLLNQHRDNLFYCVNREDNHLKELIQ